MAAENARADGGDPQTAAEADERESRAIDLALSCKLAEAGHAAIRDCQRLGLPRTVSRGGKLIRIRPDGIEEVLEEFDRAPFVRPPNVRLLEPR